ncbi:hypothetical protein ISN45_Aa06g029910 [Arabidopsis thaliana x Arabidopsis arenosa]|uniref:MULE transposase domain-containing protein n=1 Tax=Arabidopsis thaliana x Arabidopsis arenosa TaxID=1240361 RepID=A0A8T1Z3C7_9BRAS|nr:hypothetical protein ISN45_Aa06g029910 [Arabidopsis thaliana x Arabidopsis arenosa]
MNRRMRKLPIRRDGGSQIEPERVEAVDHDEPKIVGGDGVAINRIVERGVAEDGGIGGVAKEIVKEEGVGYDSHDSSVDEDDCPVIVEDSSGYRDDDDEYEAERPFTHGKRYEDLLALNKTFNNADEFKYALLWYSLKTEYDGDNRIFPIAWAVVELDDIDNWMWFVQLLKKTSVLKMELTLQ